ncbi:MAG: SUMF1/EgtB/PvdO family nonheme iron enzyme [Methylococcales bacterium]
MSEAIPDTFATNGFFQAGGTLKANVPSYIERPADRELVQCILAGDYCYILTPRQMGKSSLMTRTAARLRDEGLRVAVVDLTGIGGDAASITADEWYYSLAHRVLRELGIAFLLQPWWRDQSMLSPLHRLMNFFEEALLGQVEGRIVVFVDEIDTTIKLPFSDDFFAAIRACFNARANDNRFSRLSFILLGVASPADLIRDPTRTPFNIGKRIDLADFNEREARLFLQGLLEQGENAERLLTRILHWTNGHPYLTQRLCVLLQADPARDEVPETRVDQLVATEFLGVARRTREDHLKVIHERIAQSPERSAIRKTYSRVLKHKSVQDQPQSRVHSALKLAGLVKTDEQGRLVVRNRIYERVFNARWIRSLRPARWKQRAAVGFLLALAIVFGWWIGAQQLTVRSGIFVVSAWLGIAYPEPEMVEIPAGRFRMGSPDSEAGRTNDEGPQHEVDVPRFGLGRYEVSFDEYDVFAFLVNADGGCANAHEVTRPSDEGWGRGNRPVINVSWRDATCYAQWLARKTGKNYRLPTEAEWEYSARAGTQTPRPWPGGLEAACHYANVFDEKSHKEINKRYSIFSWEAFPCGDGYPFTAPVGSFPPNEFHLYDMLGNVWEWTQDCWHDNYRNAPENGAAWLEANGGDGGRRVIRGGSWFDRPARLRSAYRNWNGPGNRNDDLGFRLAQDL